MFGKKAILLAGIIGFTALILAGCGDTPQQRIETPTSKKAEVKLPENYKKFVNKKDGFSIGYPKDWECKDLSGIIQFKSPKEPGAPMAADLTISAKKIHSGISLNKYLEASIEETRQYIPTYKEIETREIDINGIKAKRVIATFSSKGTDFKILSFYLVRGNKGMELTGTAVPGSFDKFEKEFDIIANTLSID